MKKFKYKNRVESLLKNDKRVNEWWAESNQDWHSGDYCETIWIELNDGYYFQTSQVSTEYFFNYKDLKETLKNGISIDPSY